MSRHNTTTKICGTCDFWTGKRIPVYDQHSMEKVDIFDRVGNCENENAKRHTGQIMQKQQKCKYYSKWSELV